MSDQTAPVTAGSLGGINLAGDEAPDVTLPPEDDRTVADPTPPAPAPEPEPEPEPEPDDLPPAAQAPKKGAPARPYVVLKEASFEDTGETYFTKVHEVEARNAQNAMRQAFKDLSQGDDGAAEAVLVVIPGSMFRPTQVRLNKTERVSVSIG
jgi:hypothetical protein